MRRCPAEAIQLQHYRDDQILCKTEALLVATGGTE